jgi:hypothetical protein
MRVYKIDIQTQTDYGWVWDTMYYMTQHSHQVDGISGYTVRNQGELELRLTDEGFVIVEVYPNRRLSYSCQSASVDKIVNEFLTNDQYLQSQADLITQ